MNRFVAVISAAMLLACLRLAGVTEEDLAKDQETAGDVLTNGMGRNLQRFSPLDTLNQGQRQEPDAGLGLLAWRRKAARPGNPAAHP